MGEEWSDWHALMQLKPGDVGTAKEVLELLFLSQANDGLGLEVISIQQMVNPMTYAFTNNFQSLDANGVEQTSVHGVGSVWATMLWDLTYYINKYGYDDNKYTGVGGIIKIRDWFLMDFKQPCSPTLLTVEMQL
jgi:hypothetical protein